MNIFSKSLVLLFLLFFIGCRGSHSIYCIKVDQQDVCFKREVWGINGDKVWITQNNNVCQKPSEKYDYGSNAMIDGSSFLYMVKGNKLNVFPYGFDSPQETFPIEIIHHQYDPQKTTEEILLKEGYQKVELGFDKMENCLSDLFPF